MVKKTLNVSFLTKTMSFYHFQKEWKMHDNSLLYNIYILNVIIYHKATILFAVHFSMQNTELLHDLARALGRGYVTVRQ